MFALTARKIFLRKIDFARRDLQRLSRVLLVGDLKRDALLASSAAAYGERRRAGRRAERQSDHGEPTLVRFEDEDTIAGKCRNWSERAGRIQWQRQYAPWYNAALRQCDRGARERRKEAEGEHRTGEPIHLVDPHEFGFVSSTRARSRPCARRASISSPGFTSVALLTRTPSATRVTMAKPRASVASGLTMCKVRCARPRRCCARTTPSCSAWRKRPARSSWRARRSRTKRSGE